MRLANLVTHNWCKALRVRRWWRKNGYEHAPCLFCFHDADDDGMPVWVDCLKGCDWGNQ